MLRIFKPEKSKGFGRVWTRKLGYVQINKSLLSRHNISRSHHIVSLDLVLLAPTETSSFSRTTPNTYFHLAEEISGTFVKLRKTALTFMMSVRPSVWNNSALNGRIFMKFGISVLTAYGKRGRGVKLTRHGSSYRVLHYEEDLAHRNF